MIAGYRILSAGQSGRYTVLLGFCHESAKKKDQCELQRSFLLCVCLFGDAMPLCWKLVRFFELNPSRDVNAFQMRGFLDYVQGISTLLKILEEFSTFLKMFKEFQPFKTYRKSPRSLGSESDNSSLVRSGFKASSHSAMVFSALLFLVSGGFPRFQRFLQRSS